MHIYCPTLDMEILHKLKNQLQERNQNTTTLGKPVQTEGKSRNNAHLGPNLPSDYQVTLSHNKTFDPFIINNVLVGNVWGFFQVRESVSTQSYHNPARCPN